MDEKYVMKAEFEKFQDEEFKPLREEVRELRVEFVGFRQEVRGDLKAVNLRIDHLTDKVAMLGASIEKSSHVMMWIAGAYALPMLFLLYKMLLGNN